MATFALSFAILLLAVGGMALGVLFGRRPLRTGGCGNNCGAFGCGGGVCRKARD